MKIDNTLGILSVLKVDVNTLIITCKKPLGNSPVEKNHGKNSL